MQKYFWLFSHLIFVLLSLIYSTFSVFKQNNPLDAIDPMIWILLVKKIVQNINCCCLLFKKNTIKKVDWIFTDFFPSLFSIRFSVFASARFKEQINRFVRNVFLSVECLVCSQMFWSIKTYKHNNIVTSHTFSLYLFYFYVWVNKATIFVGTAIFHTIYFHRWNWFRLNCIHIIISERFNVCIVNIAVASVVVFLVDDNSAWTIYVCSCMSIRNWCIHLQKKREQKCPVHTNACMCVRSEHTLIKFLRTHSFVWHQIDMVASHICVKRCVWWTCPRTIPANALSIRSYLHQKTPHLQFTAGVICIEHTHNCTYTCKCQVNKVFVDYIR